MCIRDRGGEATRLARHLRYDARVYLTPPWSAIHVQDSARRHGFPAALEEYRRLRSGYPRLGYQVALLPRIGIRARADWLLARVGL